MRFGLGRVVALPRVLATFVHRGTSYSSPDTRDQIGETWTATTGGRTSGRCATVLDHHGGRRCLDARAPALGILMRCDGCGIEAPALKSAVCRVDRERQDMLCDSCWLALRELVWVDPGRLDVWDRCWVCGGWESANVLRDVKPGYPVSGVCVDCAG